MDKEMTQEEWEIFDSKMTALVEHGKQHLQDSELLLMYFKKLLKAQTVDIWGEQLEKPNKNGWMKYGLWVKAK